MKDEIKMWEVIKELGCGCQIRRSYKGNTFADSCQACGNLPKNFYAPDPRIEGLLEALEFYADEDNYDDNSAPIKLVTSHECVHEFIEEDLGKTAKQALKKYKEGN